LSPDALVNELYRQEKNNFAKAVIENFNPPKGARELFRMLWTRMAAYATDHMKSFVFLELHHHARYLDQQRPRPRAAHAGSVLQCRRRPTQARWRAQARRLRLLHGHRHGARSSASSVTASRWPSRSTTLPGSRRAVRLGSNPHLTVLFLPFYRNEVHSTNPQEPVIMSTTSRFVTSREPLPVSAARRLSTLPSRATRDRVRPQPAELAKVKQEAGAAKLDTLLLDVTSNASIEAAVLEVDRLTGGRGLGRARQQRGFGVLGPTSRSPSRRCAASTRPTCSA